MKLLAKNEIDALKSKERQRDIDEGLKLARKVDSLREIQAQEEASLKQFREKTISEIQKEIVERTKERDELRAEVSVLRRERFEALRPINEERQRVDEMRQKMWEENEILSVREGEIRQREEDSDKMSKKIKRELDRVSEERDRTRELLGNANAKDILATQNLKEAESAKQKAIDIQVELERKLESLKSDIESAKKRHQRRDEQQDEREKALNARETKIKDRENMLLRTIKRKK